MDTITQSHHSDADRHVEKTVNLNETERSSKKSLWSKKITSTIPKKLIENSTRTAERHKFQRDKSSKRNIRTKAPENVTAAMESHDVNTLLETTTHDIRNRLSTLGTLTMEPNVNTTTKTVTSMAPRTLTKHLGKDRSARGTSSRIFSKVKTKAKSKHRKKKSNDFSHRGPLARRISSVEQLSEQPCDTSSTSSDEVVVFETEENQSYAQNVILSLLSRASLREQYWSNKIAAYFIILSYLTTYESISGLFLYANKYGTFFMINYSICMLFIGFPMCYLEMALGQYTSTGIYLVFDRMVPAFVGIAISALSINFLNLCVNHNVLIDNLAVVSEAAVITQSQMPWNHCLNRRDNRACYAWPRSCDRRNYITYDELSFSRISSLQSPVILIGDTCVQSGTNSIFDGLTKEINEDYITAYMTTPMMTFMLREIEDFVEWKKLIYPSCKYYLLSVICALLMIYILTRPKRELVFILKFASVITFGVLLFFLNTTLILLRPSDPYVYSFNTGDGIQKILLNWSAWTSAINLTLQNLKLGEGAWTFFGSLFNFHNNVFLDCLVMTLFMIFVPFFYTLFHMVIIDSYVLERSSNDLWKAFNAFEVRTNRFYINPFTMVTALLDALHVFKDYSIVITFYYAFIVAISTLTNKIIRAEIIISALMEVNVSLGESYSATILVILVVLSTMLFQFFATSENGHNLSVAFKQTVTPISSNIIVLLELFTIGIFYGFRVIYSNTSFMMNKSLKIKSEKELSVIIIILILWSVVIPILTLLTVVEMFNDFYAEEKAIVGYVYITMICIVLLPVPALLILRVYRRYSSGYSIIHLFKRNPDLWGPRLRSHRSGAEKAERMIRKWW